MKPWLRNTLIVMLALVLLGSGASMVMSIPKPIIFPKDVSAEEREANRRIAFAGAHNFRDLGGYKTENGATVKWGVLYRSDALHKLTNRDLEYLVSLDLSRVIDFRADFEKEEEPDRFPENYSFKVVALPIFDTNSQFGQELRQRIVDGDVAGIDGGALLADANAQFATDFTPEFKTFMQEVKDAHGGPVLFHCTAGKDRTGFAAAILLRILGVPQETVMQDYMLSKDYSLSARARDIFIVRLTSGKESAAVVQTLLGVEREYLQTAFDTIDAEYGSFDAYVREGLGLTDQDIFMLRTTLLE